MTSRSIVALALALALGTGCERPARDDDDDAPRCEDVGSVAATASAAERHLLGAASPYPADATLRARRAVLERSQRARRAAAWEVVTRVLAPVSLSAETATPGAEVPRFRTWYDREDVARVFQHAYEGLGAERRAARARFDDGELDAAFTWNVERLRTLPTWPETRWEAYLASLDEAAEIAGVGGVRRIALSPDAARHVMASYPEILRCLDEGAPDAFVDTPGMGTQRLAREAFRLARCSERSFGPFFVAAGGTLRARIEGAGARGVEVRVAAGLSAERATSRCEAPGAEGCEVAGPGMFFVRVVSAGRSAEGALVVSHDAPDVALAACLEGPFPLRAATVAAEWRRIEPGETLPTYDTSEAGLARRLAGEATWGEGDGAVSPDERAIYTIRVAEDVEFVLAGLHIRTRELDRWMNVTLWWSPEPDGDFGADRPEAVRALGGPWSSYKMCVAIEHDEQDDDPAGGFGDDAPTLAAALAAVHEGAGGPSWCSNPYIDAGPGLVRSNCVGCHQHAMSGVRPAEVAEDELRFPDAGRALVRNNVPADQFWGLDGGDDLAAVLVEVVDHWD